MIAGLLLGLAAAATSQPPLKANSSTVLQDAAQAIDAGRLDQARLMISRAIGAGAKGPSVERLLADLAFASGKYDEALSRYQQLLVSAKGDAALCERGAIAALRLDRENDAKPLVDCATASPQTSWRAWNARGVLADLNRDWEDADRAYGRARELAPDEATVLNNQAWSHVLRGDWSAALPLLQQAAAIDPQSGRIADNLELVRAALSPDLPKRKAAETGAAWAARLNDAGVAAELDGEKDKAVAAFTQALEASDSWYGRASNNLDAVSSK